ncbi:hypothetical protein ACOBQX_24715 [Actinokineospora sp. G85]|uniref:hypothetical protein n=1 Tax=Actinokineospora sp. G85 TaxID=3406626 RepID=UPI003C72B7B3
MSSTVSTVSTVSTGMRVSFLVGRDDVAADFGGGVELDDRGQVDRDREDGVGLAERVLEAAVDLFVEELPRGLLDQGCVVHPDRGAEVPEDLVDLTVDDYGDPGVSSGRAVRRSGLPTFLASMRI